MKKLSKVFDDAIERSRRRTTIHGLMGKRLTDGSYTFVVDGFPESVWVTMRLSSGAQTVVPAVNSAGLPHSPKLAVDMRKEGDNYVIIRRSAEKVMATPQPTDPSGNSPHIHSHLGLTDNDQDVHPQYHNDSRGDARYYKKSDGVLEGAADGTDKIAVIASGVLNWLTLDNIRDYIKSYYDSVVATLTNKIIDASNNTITNINTSALANDAVSNAKLANMVQAAIKGRQVAGGTGDPEDLTAAQVMAITKATQLLSDAGFNLVTDGTNALIERQTTATGSGLRLVVDLRATSTGNVSDGFGPAFFFSLKDIDGVVNNLGAIGAVRDGSDATGNMQLRAYIAGISTIIATAGQNGFAVVNALSAGGAVDFDSTLNVDGATTLNTATVKPGTASDTAKVSGLLFSSRTQVGNVGAGEDVLVDYSLAANSLSADNQSIRIYACGTFANNANTKRLRLRFGTGGTNLVLDTTALSGGAAENWELNATIMRTGAATQKGVCRITVSDPTLLNPTSDQMGFVTTLNQTLSGAVTVRISGEATANNDILIEMCKIWWDGENT